MAPETNEGTAYLQALKQGDNLSSGAPAAAPATMESSDSAPVNPGAAPQHNGVEKRRSPRYQCEGSAEMAAEGCDIRTWASLKDISMHGCYVEATSTYPVGTNLALKLAANGFQVGGNGTVRVNYPYLGMGIAFTEMSQDDRARLRSLLQSVARPSVSTGPAAACPSATSLREAVPMNFDSGVAVQALIQLFEKRQMLLRDEFVRILRNSQASGKPTER